MCVTVRRLRVPQERVLFSFFKSHISDLKGNSSSGVPSVQVCRLNLTLSTDVLVACACSLSDGGRKEPLAS